MNNTAEPVCELSSFVILFHEVAVKNWLQKG